MIDILTADWLDIDEISRTAPPREVKLGRALYRDGKAHIDTVETRAAQLSVHEGSDTFIVSITLRSSQIYASCTCSYHNYWMLCRHRVAAIMALAEHLTKNPPSVWRAVLSEVSQQPAQRKTTPAQKLLLFSLQQLGSSWTIVPHSLPAKHFSPEILRDHKAIAAIIEAQNLSPEAKPLRSRVNPQQFLNATPDQIAAASLAMIPSSAGYYSSHNYLYSSTLSDSLLSYMPHSIIFVGEQSDPLQFLVEAPDEPASIEIEIAKNDTGMRAVTTIAVAGKRRHLEQGSAETIFTKPLWLLVDDSLLVHIDEAPALAPRLIEYPDLNIPAAEQDEFLEQYLLPLAEAIPVQGDVVAWEDIEAQPTPRLYLSETEGQLQAELRFAYSGYELPYEKSPSEVAVRRKQGEATLARIRRDTTFEQTAYQEASSHGLKRGVEQGQLLLRRGTDVVDFLLHHAPRLLSAGYEIFGEDALKSAKVNREKATISFNVSSGIDWFDVAAEVRFGNLTVPMKEIRRALRKKERYIKLADGSIGAIPDEWVDRYRHLFALADETDSGFRLSQHHLTMVDQLLGEADRVKTDSVFEERRQRLRDFSTITQQELPKGFRGELRDYQKAGYDWLHFLHEYNFGGCLADDMGLGKTVQVLTFLLSLRESGHAKSADLIVLPRSLIFNWQREATTFAPDLKVAVYADQDRMRDVAEFDGYDLVLTTYGIMRRDIEVLRKYQFHYLVLDESQAIKNPVAETSKAARLLKGEHRLALTGTPIENSTSELWSQFAFLNPGLLGSLDYFREEFVTPIERKQNEESATFLRKMVFPFILRRTKDQVAKDLPPRTERVIEGEMEPAQRKFYNKQRDYYRKILLHMIEVEGMQNSRMKILEGLLRLRQTCNHPRLVDPDYKGGSAKLELLIETLETLRAEGHKALIFSQFVQMLSIVREELDARGVPYAYLDGSTRDRQGEVDRFQSDAELPFFLISLKAGGVGLNLTAADYVIHIDPWWNPAVEMQATDRTHRIGQDKPVFVYKLVVRESVEEKILQLQAQKRALVDQLIASDSGVFKSLTRDDVEVLFT